MMTKARSLHPCNTLWPCAWIALDDSHEPSPVYCQAAPFALLLFSSARDVSAADSAASTQEPLLHIPYTCVRDVVVISPGILHVHLTGEGLRDASDSRAMQDAGMCAMEERIRNTVIRAKREGLIYQAWLCKYVGESDFDAEFSHPQTRRNLKWHQRFDAYSGKDEMTHLYTNPNTLDIELDRLEKTRVFDASSESQADLPEHIITWLRDRGEAILLVSPCPSNPLAALLSERLTTHQDRGYSIYPNGHISSLPRLVLKRGRLGFALTCSLA
jgi:hypothetical protein